jgi:hypothetical protein
MRAYVLFGITASVIAMSGCASISVRHLDPTGSHRDGVSGIRYYLPRPYLLVTLLPPEADSVAPSGADTDKLGAGKKAPATPQKGDVGQEEKGSQDGQGQGVASGNSLPAQTDSDFSARTSQYVVKLIYLPDLHNPMALQMRAGLFGSISAQPTLQNGWLLTNLQGSADNSQLLVSAIGALAGNASKGSSGGTSGKSSSVVNLTDFMKLVSASDQILQPGLYSFNYDDSGQMTGLCLMTAFGAGNATSPERCPPSQAH